MPEQQKPAQRHHVVSKFYLRRFTNPRRQLIRRPLDESAHLQSVNDATVRKDFYTVHADGVEQDDFEKQLGKFETEAAKAFNAMLNEKIWPPTPEQRLSVSSWIGLQYVRGENKRRMVEELDRAFLTEVGTATTGHLRNLIGVPEEATDDEVEGIRTYMLTTGTRSIDHHAHLASIGEILERAVPAVFFRQPWILVDFSWDALGTSDTPVVLVPDAAPIAGLGGVGIGSAPELYVPLSTRVGLWMGEIGSEASDERVPGNRELMQAMNRLTLYSARRALYYHPDTDPFAEFEMPQPREQEPAVPHEQINSFGPLPD